MRVSVEEQKKMFEEHLRLQGTADRNARKTEGAKVGDQKAGRAREEKSIRTHVVHPKNIQIKRWKYSLCDSDVDAEIKKYKAK